MNLRNIGKLFHVFMFGLFVSSTSYKVLAIPKTEPEKLYGGRIKFLTFIDAVSACELSLRGFMTGDEDVNKLIYCNFLFFHNWKLRAKLFDKMVEWICLYMHAYPFSGSKKSFSGLLGHSALARTHKTGNAVSFFICAI